MESIRDKVAIVGMGCTHFGERWDMGVEDLLVEAAHEAFEDAGIHPSDIQAAWLGTVFSGVTAITMSPLGLQYIPMTRVENMCATGSEALRGAAYAVASGACDMALAIGVEKLKDSGQTGVKGPAIVGDNPDGSSAIGSGFSAPASFAYLGTRYFHHYHLAPEYGKELLAKIAVKNHDNGALNPKAHFHNKLSVQQVVRAPIVAWPLGLLDCCGVSDGAAAAIVVPADKAKDYRPDPIYVKALQLALTPATGIAHQSWDGIHLDSTKVAGAKAYEEAGIEKPREEIDLMEVHDCFSISELVTYEDLQISPDGQARQDVEEGFYDLDGKIPCQSDGGLKCFGHPIGASGIRMTYEIYKQLQGKAEPEERQLTKDIKLGLTHNHGGIAGSLVCSVAIFGK